MSKNPSIYTQNLARLSARIFGLQVPSEKAKVKYINKYLSKKPYYKDRRFVQYYPPVRDVHNLFKNLRYFGLFVDEHLDFTEAMERQRALRGKGKKKRY